MGLQRDAAGSLASCKTRSCNPFPQRLVQPSHSYESRTTQESCSYHQGAFFQCLQLQLSWNNQCGCRGNQQQDHGHQAKTGRLSQSQKLQNHDLFLLWWTTTLPKIIPDEPILFLTSQRPLKMKRILPRRLSNTFTRVCNLKDTLRSSAKQLINNYSASFPLTLSPKIRARISQLKDTTNHHHILFPTEYKYQGCLRLRIFGCGLKDKIYTHLSTAIAYCLDNDYTLDWDGDLQFYGKWTDWFLPFLPDSNHIRDELPTIDYTPNWTNMPETGMMILKNYPPSIIQEIWKPNPLLQNHACEASKRFGLDGRCYAAVQVRRGDKLKTGQIQQVRAVAIINRLPKDAKLLFVATDDYSVVDELTQLTKIPIITLCPPTQRGSFGEYDTFSPGDPQRKADSIRLFTDLELCRKASYFIQIRPKTFLNSIGIRNYQISDMLADLRLQKHNLAVR